MMNELFQNEVLVLLLRVSLLLLLGWAVIALVRNGVGSSAQCAQ